ncbi:MULTISPECIES: LPS export ABC transporter periplasmic protein LptC [unclassified Novosphingobium]|jgi:lipopolysaccharide export system protein LptC|uniref:LPS export ABC transporter periplasmic protein LptC n=1 Tax=Novosphingobium TaxID=165696 RepID=UPI000784EEF2|nr:MULTISPECIES: LPS export ABC transporter periplasmic protein LptC [unclassified Novosphingobium]QOV96314.1 LPS export ABC transporter periplasmic protein LptC [Novosphingobium sp. ES2-1]
MTVAADTIRTQRRSFAAPGGFHDRLVHFLARGLPALVGALLAVMIITPLSPRGEISFLLDRRKVAMVNERMQVSSAMYRGQDDDGRNFSITAGSAVQRTKAQPMIELDQLTARIMLDNGPALLTAGRGNYDFGKEIVDIAGPINVQTSDGYRMTATNVDIDLGSKTLKSRGPVEGRIPAGTFSADRISANLNERTVALEGNARLRMVPGRMQMP